MGRRKVESPATPEANDDAILQPTAFLALAEADEAPQGFVKVESPATPPKVSPRKLFDVLMYAGGGRLVEEGVEAVDEAEAIQRALLSRNIPQAEVCMLRFEVLPSGNAA